MNAHEIDKLGIAALMTGDLPPAKEKVLREHLESCETCRKYANLLHEEKREFLSRYPFESMHQHHGATVYRFPSYKYVYALAATIILAIVGSTYLYRNPAQQEMAMRTKGGAGAGEAIRCVVKKLDGSIEQRSTSVYHPGERIQCIYSTAARNAFILLSIDEKGVLSTYFPASGDSSILLERGTDIPLPSSILLDNYLGRELFIAMFSKKPVPVSPLKEKVLDAFNRCGSLDSLKLGGIEAISVHQFLITKQPR
jgi:hypothetical protein